MFIDMNKRRSSLKYGRRRSRSLGGILTKEICSTIDKSLPPSERLKPLLSYTVDTALSSAVKEFYEGPDCYSFQKSCSECIEKFTSALESENLYSLAVSEDELTNSSLSSKNIFPQFHAAMEKLADENKAWDNLESKYNNDIEKEKNASTIPFRGSFDYKGHGKIYSDILKDVLSIGEQTKFQLEELRKKCDEIVPYKRLANKYIASVNTEIEDYFVDAAQGTPRTLIKRCLINGSQD